MTRPNYPVLRFLRSPIGRRVERALWRVKPYKAITGRLVWRELAQGGLEERLSRANADVEAGRGWKFLPNEGWEEGLEPPLESWKPDDPQQPNGWHHDGERWVLNDDGGWFKDPYDFWRYNHPGEVGWQEQPNGSWKYSDEPTKIGA